MRINGDLTVRRDLAGESHDGEADTWRHGEEWKFAVEGGVVVGKEESTPVIDGTWAGPPQTDCVGNLQHCFCLDDRWRASRAGRQIKTASGLCCVLCPSLQSLCFSL